MLKISVDEVITNNGFSVFFFFLGQNFTIIHYEVRYFLKKKNDGEVRRKTTSKAWKEDGDDEKSYSVGP